MQRTGYTVRGERVDELFQEFGTTLSPQGRYSGDGFEVRYYEEYTLLTNSNMLIVAVLERTDEREATVQLFSGGGASGLIGMDLGAERTGLEGVKSEFESVFDALGLESEPKLVGR